MRVREPVRPRSGLRLSCMRCWLDTGMAHYLKVVPKRLRFVDILNLGSHGSRVLG